MLQYVEKIHGGNFHRKLFEILLFYAAQKKLMLIGSLNSGYLDLFAFCAKIFTNPFDLKLKDFLEAR